jgi:ABC-type Fe3+-hydroxamate transport system substrate-binding protein
MTPQSFSDQTGHKFSLDSPPQRIVSLVPSQTELLAYLGLNERVVGITKFCVHPASWRQSKTIIGGTKKFHLDIIHSLKPDLIIGNKEENYRAGIEELREKYPVWTSDIVTLDDALAMISSIGAITDTQIPARQCSKDIVDKFRSVKKFHGQTVLYLIWRRPWMAAAQETFIHSMLTTLGLRNVLESEHRYPQVSSENIRLLAPAYIFLSSEPYPFGNDHIQEIREISPSSKILLVDGEMFSWYGSRLIHAPDYFNTLELS